MLESSVSKSIIKALKEIKGLWFIRVELKFIRGIPDILGVKQGRFFALETKRNESEALAVTPRTIIQNRTLKKIRDAGGYATMIYPENQNEILDEIRGL